MNRCSMIVFPMLISTNLAWAIGPAMVTREPLADHARFWRKAIVISGEISSVSSDNLKGLLVQLKPAQIESSYAGDKNLKLELERDCNIFVPNGILLLGDRLTLGEKYFLTAYQPTPAESKEYFGEEKSVDTFLITPYALMGWKEQVFGPIVNVSKLSSCQKSVFNEMISKCHEESRKVFNETRNK